MKILQVNNFYNWGSTGKITHVIHQGLLAQGHDSLVCYGRGAATEEDHVVKICPELCSRINNVRSRITGIMYGGFGLSTKRLKRIIRQERPDVVHLQCLNCFFVNIYEIVDWLKRNHIKTVLTLHAEFMYTANCSHALECEKWRTGCGGCPRYKKETRSWFVDGTHRSFVKMADAFRGFDEDLTVVSVSPWLRDRAVQSPILENMRHTVIYNGVDTSVFYPRDCEWLRRQHNIQGLQVIFHATPSFSDEPGHLKGGRYVLELAERMKDFPAVFLVAGKTRLSGPVPENVILLGNIEDQNLLAAYYSLADLTLLTSRKETFSMVCAESLCCGTPVFGFEAGAPELIALPGYSGFAPQGDADALEALVAAYLWGEPFDRREVSGAAERAYSRETMLRRYMALYGQMMHGSDAE